MAQELKAYGMDDPEVGDEYEMYKVSEVDAVLAEKDKEIAELKARIQLDDDEMAGFLQLEEECGGGDLGKYIDKLRSEIRHQKYKRCLAMAKWCEYRWTDIATQYYKSVLYRKWQLRWLELAEKFKEAK